MYKYGLMNFNLIKEGKSFAEEVANINDKDNEVRTVGYNPSDIHRIIKLKKSLEVAKRSYDICENRVNEIKKENATTLTEIDDISKEIEQLNKKIIEAQKSEEYIMIERMELEEFKNKRNEKEALFDYGLGKYETNLPAMHAMGTHVEQYETEEKDRKEMLHRDCIEDGQLNVELEELSKRNVTKEEIATILQKSNFRKKLNDKDFDKVVNIIKESVDLSTEMSDMALKDTEEYLETGIVTEQMEKNMKVYNVAYNYNTEWVRDNLQTMQMNVSKIAKKHKASSELNIFEKIYKKTINKTYGDDFTEKSYLDMFEEKFNKEVEIIRTQKSSTKDYDELGSDDKFAAKVKKNFGDYGVYNSHAKIVDEIFDLGVEETEENVEEENEHFKGLTLETNELDVTETNEFKSAANNSAVEKEEEEERKIEHA